MALEQLLQDPNYINANAATKAAIFDKFAPSDPNFVKANPKTQEAIKEKFGVSENAFVEDLRSGQTESVLYNKPNKNLAKVALQGLVKGGASLADLAVGMPTDIQNLADYVGAPSGAPVPVKARPVQSYLQKEGIITPENEPNTPFGKAIGFTTEVMGSGGINPKTVGQSLLQKPLREAAIDISKQFGRTTAAGAVGSGTQQSMESVGASPIQQMIGTALTMGGTGAATGGVRTTTADIANKGLQGVSPEQIAMAKLLMQDSYKIGSPITAAEAIAQVTGNKILVGKQRFLENAPASQGTMNEFMQARPAGQRKALESSVEVIGAPPSYSTPLKLEQTAKNVVRGAEKNLTASVNPFYQQGVNQMQNIQAGKVLPVLSSEVEALRKNPAIDDAINHVINDKYSGATGLPATNPETLNAAKVYLDAQYNNFLNKTAGSLDKTKAGNAWGGSRELDAYLSSKSPAYSRGSQNFEVAQKTQIGLLKAGPVGLISEGANAADVLMPKNPINLYPADIKRTAELLRRKDPSALPEWTRQQLEGEFNKSARELVGGENQFAGPKFRKDIIGNKAQEDNLRTLVTEASGMQAWQGFNRFLDVMQAQGQRLPANSATAFNELLKEEMSGGKMSKLATPFKISNVVNWLENKQLGKNSEMLAKMLVDPNGVAKLEELARTGPRSAKAQALANALAGAYAAPNQDTVKE